MIAQKFPVRVSETKLVKITLPCFKSLTAADLSPKDDFDQLFNFQGPVISECTIVRSGIHTQPVFTMFGCKSYFVFYDEKLDVSLSLCPEKGVFFQEGGCTAVRLSPRAAKW